jgi:iron complex outermembrane receptor protein
MRWHPSSDWLALCAWGIVVPFSQATEVPRESTPRQLEPLEEVVVTGSRLPLTVSESAVPVVTLGRRDLERGAPPSIGRVLQSLPMSTGSPMNPNVNAAGSAEQNGGDGDWGDGSYRLDLHGMPTVVLLNGRRLSNGGIGADSSVDLGTIPMNWIDRVEVVTGGASAIYGADAVGGVVNLLTREAERGLDAKLSRSISDRGDGEILSAQASAGFELFGAGWSIGIDHASQDGVTLDRRGYSALPLGIVDVGGAAVSVGGNNGLPEGLFNVPVGNALGLDPGLYTRMAGSSGLTAADYLPFERAIHGFNPAPYNYSQTPHDATSLWLLGSHSMTETASWFFEGLAHWRSSAQQAAPRALFGSDLPLQLADGTRGIPANNYYNPFGVDMRPAFGRRLVEAGERRFTQDVELWRVLIGVKGEIYDWTWEISAAHAASEADETGKGEIDERRLALALGPSGLDVNGRIVCGIPDPASGRVEGNNVIAGCVPLNLFGGVGSVTPEQLDYVSPRPSRLDGSNEQSFAQAVFGGPWGRTSAGEIRWILGVEFRRDSGSLKETPLSTDQLMDAQGVLNLSGEFSVRELFGEARLPLARDRRLAQDLAISIGARLSDSSAYGTNDSWQAGLHWRPRTDWTFRANLAEVFRAPNLGDLYSRVERFDGWFEIDPCGNRPTPVEQVNCAANGVPGGAYVQGAETFVVLAGGNPALRPESGRSLGAGFVYAPRWAQGLTASVDYFSVTLDDHIAQAFVDEALIGCARLGARQLCDDIERLPDGSLASVTTMTENMGRLEVSGTDLSLSWSLQSGRGNLGANLLATYLDRWNEQLIPGGRVSAYAGNSQRGARPQWRGLASIDWSSGAWSASYSAEYIGSFDDRVFWIPMSGPEFDSYLRRVEPVLYHDLEAGFEFDAGLRIRAGVTNATDEDPPFLSHHQPANTDAATYRLLGRTYFLELRYELD